MAGVRLFASGVLALACAFSAQARSQDPLAVAFGTLYSMWHMRLSPDGSKLSYLQMHSEDLPIAVVLDTRTGRPAPVLASVPEKFDIQWCDWANDERLLCGFVGNTKDGHFIYPVSRLVAVNADGSEMKVLLQRKLWNQFAPSQDNVVDLLVNDPRNVLVQMPRERGDGVSRLDVYSGSTGVVDRERDHIYTYISDGRGEPRLRFYVSDREIRWYYRISGDDKWRILREWKTSDDEDFSPVGFGSDPNRLLVLKPHQGRLALWALDLANGLAEKVVFAHPEVDVGGALQLGKFERMVAVGYSTDVPHLHFFDEDVERIIERIGAAVPGRVVEVVDESWDRAFYLVHIGSDRDPGSYYRFDVRRNRLQRVARQYPLLEGRSLAPMTPIRYPAADGTEIPGYLTLPPNASSGPLPAVVFPHGGPDSRDYWEFHWLVQFLAAKGYAVLQSNYRGSGGYGEAWEGEGGFRAWRLAVGDIRDGVQHLVEQGIADPNRICVVGWSYGGYAALLSAIEDPERYRCVVSIAGVTDPGTLIRDYRYTVLRQYMKNYVGTDDEIIDAGSPLKRADEFRAPVLLFHGDLDINVSIEHSEKLDKALKRAKKKREFIKYEGVEHQIFRNEYRIDMLDKIGAFLDRHIGKPAKTATTAAAP